MSVPREPTRGSGLINPQMASLSASTPALNLTGSIASPPKRLTAQDKLPWASDSCPNLRQPKAALGSPAKQLKRPVRQMSAHAYGVKATSFGSTAPRFELGEQSFTPGSRFHSEAMRASQAALSVLAANPDGLAEALRAGGALQAGRRTASAKIGGELPIHCLEPPEATPFGIYDPKLHGVGAQKANAPKWSVRGRPPIDFQPVQQTRAKPEWNPPLDGHGGPLQYEHKAWMSAISRKKVSSAQPNRPKYSFPKESYGFPSPATMGGKKMPSDFGAGSQHEMHWVASGIAKARQPDSRRPSSAFGHFGNSSSSRFGDDDPLPRGRPPTRAGAATVSGLALDAAPQATKPKLPNRGCKVRPKSAWSGEERGCLEDRGGAVKGAPGDWMKLTPGDTRSTSNPLRFGRNAVVTPAPGRYSHEGTQTGQRLTLSTHKSSSRPTMVSRNSDTFQGTFDYFPGPGQYL